MTKKSNSLLMLFSIVGWLVAFYALWHKIKLTTSGYIESSFCNINALFNCDAVALSAGSEILGIPIAALGMLFYSVILAISLNSFFDNLSDDKDKAWKFKYVTHLFIVSCFALAFSLYQFAYSVFDVRALCLMCVSLYVIDLCIFTIALKSYIKRDRSLSFSISKNIVICLGVLTALNLFIPNLVKNHLAVDKTLSKNMDFILRQYEIQPVKKVFTTTSPTVGKSENPKVRIIEFSDFQCPYCAKNSSWMAPFINQKDVLFSLKHYPLDPSCNPQIKRNMHPLACYSAYTAQCVFDLSGSNAFFSFKKSLFKKQKILSKDLILSEAKTLSGKTEDVLKTCINSSETHAKIAADIEEGNALNITGTPTVFINGKKLGRISPEIYHKIIRRYTN